jgi:hypothetical protein
MPDSHKVRGRPLSDLVGQRFERLLVLHYVPERKKWECICDCGKTTFATTYGLTSNNRKSCGCLGIENSRKNGGKNALPPGDALCNDIYLAYRRRAKDKKIAFDLSKEQFKVITKKSCFYCGKEPSQIRHGPQNNGIYIYNGIDRVDTLEGYTLENCVPCCKHCNAKKKDITVDMMIKSLEFLGYRQ